MRSRRPPAEERLLAARIAAAGDRSGIIEVPSSRLVQGARRAAQVVLGVALGLAIWQAFALALNAGGSTLGFPGPVDTFTRLGEYLFAGRSLYGHSLYEHIAASLQRLLVAFALATVFGVVVGSALGFFGRLYPIGMVPVSIYQMIPGLAWLPVAILLFGLGDESAVFIIWAVSAMVITIGVSSGIRQVPSVLVNAARMTGAGGLAIFWHVLIPQAAASIVNALRLGMSAAWRVLIAAEMVVGMGLGVGYSIELTRDLLDYVGAFACITVICLLGLAIDRIVLASVERWMRHRLGADAE